MGDKLLLFLNIAIAVVSLLFALVMLFKSIRNIKTSKTQAEREKAISSTLESVEQIYNIFDKVPSFISQAETLFGNGNGERKNYFVMKEIENECIKRKVDFDANKDKFMSTIENILSTPQKKELNITNFKE